MVYIKASERREQVVSAARRVLTRDGVGGTTLRAVSAEADIPLGTLQYVFPSKELLFRAVIEDLMEQILEVLQAAADLADGLEHAIRQGLATYWTQMVEDDPQQRLMAYELMIYALRTPGLENLGRWQVEEYSRIVGEWCHEAANNAGEICGVPFDTLGRVLVASVFGLVLQYISDPNQARSRRDLQAATDMLVQFAGIRAPRAPIGG